MTFAAMNPSSSLQPGSSSWKLNNRTVAAHETFPRLIVHMTHGERDSFFSTPSVSPSTSKLSVTLKKGRGPDYDQILQISPLTYVKLVIMCKAPNINIELQISKISVLFRFPLFGTFTCAHFQSS